MLNTDRYTGEEVTRLVTMLQTNFNLNGHVQSRGSGSKIGARVRLKEAEYSKLRKVVENEIVLSMIYKVRGCS